MFPKVYLRGHQKRAGPFSDTLALYAYVFEVKSRVGEER